MTSVHEPIFCHILLAVGPSLSRQDRYILQEVIKLAGAALKQIVNSPTAAAHFYALEKSFISEKSSKIVVFIDIEAHDVAVCLQFHRAQAGATRPAAAWTDCG
jgi:hypothetical protein